MSDIDTTPETAESSEAEDTMPSFAEVSAEKLAEIKKDLVTANSTVARVFKGGREAILKIQTIGQELIARGSSAGKFGQRIIESLEEAAVILDLESVSPVFRNTYGAVSGLINDAAVAIESAEEEMVDAAATVDLIRNELIASSTRYNQLAFRRPHSDLYVSDETTSDTFNVLNSADSVRSRIKFIVDRGEAIGVAVVVKSGTSDNVVHAYYFGDYLTLCDGVFGRPLNLQDSNEGGFIYRTVMQIAVSTADSVVSLFGALNDSAIDKDTADGRGLRFASDTLVDATQHDVPEQVQAEESHEPEASDAPASEEISEEIATEVEGEQDAEMTESGDITVDADGFSSITLESVNEVPEAEDAFAA